MPKSISRRNFIHHSTVTALGLSFGCSSSRYFDLLIKNGLIYDGTGATPYRGDIGINGDRIEAIGNLRRADAYDILDAKNLAVCPGFIDIHTHTDIELMANPKGESKVRQGVTTEVGGNCGSSPFPMDEKALKELQTSVLEKYGFKILWYTSDDFLKILDDFGISMNFATFTGHGDLRTFVIGKNDVQPTPGQLDEMKRHLRESMEHGTLGLSTGLEYAPGSYAETPELVELCKVVKEMNGVYATHIRNEDDFVEEAVDEALTICRKTEVSLQISHLKSCNPKNWSKTERVLKKIQMAIDAGLPVKADRYPYTAYGTGLTAFLPLWSRQGDTDEILARLKNNNDIEKIKNYTKYRGERIGGWEKVVISSCFSEENKVLQGLSIADAAAIKKIEPFEFIRSLLIEERNRVGIVGFAMNEKNLQKVLSAPFVMIGSDGSAVAPYGKLGTGKPHPRYYGTFPRVLGKYSRDEKLFDLSTAISKMTSMPAEKLGMKDRGVIKEKMYADLVVFNPETIVDKATFTDPHQYPDGIVNIVINGDIMIQRGKHRGSSSGRVIRLGSV